MKKLFLLTKTLLAVALLCVGQNAWAATETFGASKKTDSSNQTITGTAVNINSASNPSGEGSYTVFGVGGEKGLKLRTGSPLTFNVNYGYRVKNITVKAYQNNKSTDNHDMTCSGFSVDGTTHNFDTPQAIPYNKEASTEPCVISTGRINATSSVTFNFINTSTTQNQIYAYITVEYEAANYKEDFESTTIDALKSAWTGNDGDSWGTTYSPTLELQTNKCNNSTTWFNTYSPTLKRQSTAYYFFGSAYTGSAYQFDAKLNLNLGSNGGESRFYIMNGAKSGTNADPSNYLFYIGVNSDGYVYISNGTNSDASTIGGLTSGTNSIAATLVSKTYKSTGWFDASCIIDFVQDKVTVTLNSTTTLSVSLKSGTEQISGFAVRNGDKYYGVVAMDDIALYQLTYPAFTLSDTEKEFFVEDNETVTLTDIIGDISVASDDTDVATASYSEGTITINGVSAGNTTITVTATNDGFKVSKTIDVVIGGFDAKYTAAKAPYDTKVASLDDAGQTYWSTNVTPATSVTNTSEYSAAVAALPTTYVAAVKAQTTAGSNMTDALKTAVEAASWTGATGTYGGVAAERYAGNDSHFSTGNILHQTVSGLRAGYYKLKFYGVANVARNLTEEYYGSGIAQMYANSETQDVDVIYQDACSPISNTYLREFEVYLAEDNSSIDFGIKNIKEGGQWYVAQALSLYYLGAEKKTYTINAVAGETVIKELATGSEWPSDTYGVYVPKAILYNSKYYVLDDPNMSNYYASYTMGATNETKEINYTLDESIVAYAEAGSNISQSTSNNASYSSGNYGHVDGQKSISLGTLGAGTYEFAAYYVSDSNRGLYLRNGNNSDKSTNTIVSPTLSSAGMVYADFQLTSSTPILFTGYTNNHSQYNQSAEFDFIYIRKTGEVATIGSTGWATFSSKNPVNVDVTGLEAYIATGEDGNYVTMQKVTGDVAANTGLVLKGAANTYALPFAASSGTTYNQSSNPKNYLFALDGTFNNVGIAGEGTNYVLSVQSGNVVWAPVTGNLAPAPAGHAALWLPASGGSSARAMRFSGDITAVEAVEAAAEAKSKDGKFIENGKIAIYKNGMKYNANGQLIK